MEINSYNININALRNMVVEIDANLKNDSGIDGIRAMVCTLLEHGKVQEVKPYLDWALDNTGALHDQHTVVCVMLDHDDIVKDILAPRFKEIMSTYAVQFDDSATNFIIPAIKAKKYRELHQDVNDLLPEVLSKETWASSNYPRLVNGWYGDEIDCDVVRPSLTKFFDRIELNSIHDDSVEANLTNVHSIEMINNINNNPHNKVLRDLTKNYSGKVITENNEDGCVLVSLQNPERPVVIWKNRYNHSGRWSAGVDINHVQTHKYPMPEILEAANECLLEISKRPYKEIAVPAKNAAKDLRHDISLVKDDGRLIMSDEYRARYSVASKPRMSSYPSPGN